MLNTFFDKYIFTNGLRYTHYNFFLMNVPFAVVPVDVLVGLARIEDLEVNRQVYAALKRQVSSSLIQSFHLDTSLDKAVLFLEDFFTASGWGLVQHVDLDAAKSRAIVVVEENPICRSLQGVVHKPVDHFLRGVLAGVFSRLFRTEVDCVEQSCMALGQGRCEFVIKPQPDFDFSRSDVREQLPLNESVRL